MQHKASLYNGVTLYICFGFTKASELDFKARVDPTACGFCLRYLLTTKWPVWQPNPHPFTFLKYQWNLKVALIVWQISKLSESL